MHTPTIVTSPLCCTSYFFSSSSYIGYSRDNIRIGRKYKEAISSIDGIYRKVLVTCGYPIGYVLAVKKGLNR